MTHPNGTLPIRVGVFNAVADADRAVRDLRAAGFSEEQISVLCSDAHKDHLFAGISPTPQAGDYVPAAITTGGVLGAAIGGLALAGTAVVTGGASLLAAGTVLIGGGAIAGSFSGAMATRGLENESVNYYDQAVQRGQILVAVEDHAEDPTARLAEAERIFAAAGAEPVPLVEG